MITSRQNPKIKHIIKLQSQAKYRHEHQQYILENTKYIEEMIAQHPDRVDFILFTTLPPSIETQLSKTKIEVIETSDAIFKEASKVATSQGMIAVIKRPMHHPQFELGGHYIYLHNISNPGNLGAIIRNAAAFNLNGVICSPDSVDPYHPDAVRGMAGNGYQLPILTLPISDLIKTLPNDTICYALDINGETTLTELSFTPNSLFIFGAEGQGGSQDLIKNLSLQKKGVKIDMSSEVESLNVAVSTGILLYKLYAETSLK